MSVHDSIRNRVIDQIGLKGAGFLVFCNTYDSVALAFLSTKKGIDAGEAEAAAQHKSLFSHFVLSDDQKFIDAIRISDKGIKVITSLHLIAWLDLMKMIDSPETYLTRLYQYHSFTSYQLRMAYKDMLNKLSIAITKKELNRRTSLFQLGIK